MTNPLPKLSAYTQKRSRPHTSEPFGPEPPVSSAPTHGGGFVVHLHAARRTHCDLRLEVSGLLKSFAIPRGPSLSPDQKRLAVQTEDHPVAYLDFEAVIPPGNYGAGAMIAWDLGRVRYWGTTAEQGLSQGKLEFELFGFKLRGRFVLVRTKAAGSDKHQWLLLKKRDAHARQADVLAEQPRSVLSGLTVDELARRPDLARTLENLAAARGATAETPAPRAVHPMLCSTGDARLDEPGHFYELKLDGVRVIAKKLGELVELRYRSLRLADSDYPEIVRAVRALPAERLLLDGEIVAFDEQGRPSFQLLSSRIHAKTGLSEKSYWRDPPVVYVAFDLLALGGRDLMPLPLRTRKELLTRLVRGRGVVRALDHLEDDGRPLHDLCRRHRLEGIVKKRADSRYVPGPKRSGAWIKIKSERDEDFVVVGVTTGTGSRARCGALDLATYAGDRLILRGKVGSGLDEKTIGVLQARFAALAVPHMPAEGLLEPAPRGRTFLQPVIVVRVRFLGWTKDGRLRHPVFVGLRADLSPKECTAAPPIPAMPAPLRLPAVDDSSSTAVDDPSSAAVDDPGSVAVDSSSTAVDDPGSAAVDSSSTAVDDPSSTAADSSLRRRVRVTHGDKVFWPEQGIRKRDLFRYYEAIAPTLLPYLRNRPVVLVRYPDGIAGKHFYQWNVPLGTPSWIRTSTIQREGGADRGATVFLVDDIDTLLHIVNLGCIPIHILAHRVDTPQYCDFVTFDLDPGPAPLSHVLRIGGVLRTLLDEVGLTGYPKSSGQSGIHVLVSLGPRISFTTGRALLALLGRLLETRCADLATMERRIDRRAGRVYIDTGQTGPSRTIVSPYSVRAHPGATVSTPLSWDEVASREQPPLAGASMQEVLDRLSTVGDPMRGMLDMHPDIASAIAKIERLVRGLAPRSEPNR